MHFLRISASFVVLAFISFVCASHTPQISFAEELPSEPQWPGKKIVILVDETPVGFINYAQLNSSFGWYALYELFIHPEYRSNGYAKELIKHTCDTLVKSGARKIFIQPGPFELGDQGQIIEIEDRAERLKNLVRLYSGSGFAPASKWLRVIAVPMYKIAGIPENPDYLMVFSV
jgi:GNAT superfamily N-acetyltransferase